MKEHIDTANILPGVLTQPEISDSCCELGNISPEQVLDYDIVVVGAGAAGVPAAGWAAELGARTALLQKEATVISQGNCGSAIIKSRSTEAGIAKWSSSVPTQSIPRKR